VEDARLFAKATKTGTNKASEDQDPGRVLNEIPGTTAGKKEEQKKRRRERRV